MSSGRSVPWIPTTPPLCYLALGVTVDGDRDVLGMWFQETEGAKFWMQVLTELKQRGIGTS
jgi:transposase-like protein